MASRDVSAEAERGPGGRLAGERGPGLHTACCLEVAGGLDDGGQGEGSGSVPLGATVPHGLKHLNGCKTKLISAMKSLQAQLNDTSLSLLKK